MTTATATTITAEGKSYKVTPAELAPDEGAKAHFACRVTGPGGVDLTFQGRVTEPDGSEFYITRITGKVGAVTVGHEYYRLQKAAHGSTWHGGSFRPLRREIPGGFGSPQVTPRVQRLECQIVGAVVADRMTGDMSEEIEKKMAAEEIGWAERALATVTEELGRVMQRVEEATNGLENLCDQYEERFGPL